jgi:hypothetical protein
MLIELKGPVQVRTNVPSPEFVTFPPGTKVNYSSKRRDEQMVHKISGWHHKYGILEAIEVTPWQDVPSWLK